MDYNKYFDFFYNITKRDLIVEKIKIYPILKDKIILNNKIKKENKNLDFFVLPIRLENDKFLLIKDLPINFFTSLTILVGEKSDLLEAKIDNEEFILTKDLFDEIDVINKEIIKKIEPKQLHNLKYKFDFEQPFVVNEIKNYLSEKKDIDFSKLHLTKSGKVENFVPNAKQIHLKLAKKMNLPLVPLIKNNFIRSSNVNVYDYNFQQKKLNPKYIIKNNILMNICKKNQIVLYNGLVTNYYLKIPHEKIISQLNKIKNSNVSITKLIDIILNKKYIKLSQNYGKYFIPLWKELSKQRFFQIKNIKQFENLTGLKFHEDISNLDKLYLQSQSGEKLFFKSQYLNENLIDLFLDNNQNDDKIYFKNIDNLILSLILNPNCKYLVYKEEIDKNILKGIEKKLVYLIKYIIDKSISLNKLPTADLRLKDEQLELYVDVLCRNIEQKINENNVMNFNEKNYDILENLNKIILLIKQNIVEYHSYNLLKIAFELKKYLFLYKEDIDINYIEELYDMYFKNIEISSKKAGSISRQVDVSYISHLSSIFDDIIVANKIINKANKKFNKSRNSNTIYNKNEEIKILFSLNTDFNIQKYLIKDFNKNIQILVESPEYDLIRKPNIYVLKQMFKYSSDKVIEGVKAWINSKSNSTKLKITLNNKDKVISIQPNYLIEYKKYKEYNVILKNDYFTLFRKIF